MHSTLNRYKLLARRWIWILLVGMVLCGGITFIVTKLLRPVYQASTLVVLTVGTSQSSYDNTTASLEMIPTYVQLIKTNSVLEPVVAQHRGLTVKQLNGMTTVKQQSNTQIIEITVENATPRLASQLSTEIAQSFAVYSNTRLGGLAQIQILPAPTPVDPVRPRPSQDALIGALVGLGLALALIVIFEWIDDRIVSPEEVQSVLGIDVLTVIPALSRKERMKNAEDTPALAEGCRVLSANLTTRGNSSHSKLIMVTSALAGEGKSTIAANLATFLAMTGKRVLLVDADLRHPVLDQHFQLKSHRGFSNVFMEAWTKIEVELEGQPTEIPSLRVLPAGLLPPNPSELLQSQLAQQVFSYFKNTQSFDYVVFDTPPLLPIADAQIIASHAQAAILVVDSSKTPRKVVQRAKQALTRSGTLLLGTVLNKSKWSEYGDIKEYLNTLHLQQRIKDNLSIPQSPLPLSTRDNTDTETRTPAIHNK